MIKEREITIFDLASELNISVATVSRALKNDPVVNKKTQKKTFQLAEKKGIMKCTPAIWLENILTKTH
jgi:LacI family transcriptional regulator